MKKLLYIVLDGLGDLPNSAFAGKTPLEAAETPHMNSLVQKGRTGLMYPIKEDIAPESDAAVISILGYDPFKYYTGRGPLESYGAGLKMDDGDLAIRCNYATLGEGDRIIDRRAGRNVTAAEATALTGAVNSQVKLTATPADFTFKSTVAHRCVLVIKRKNGKLSGNITNTDPAYSRVGGLGVAKAEVGMNLERCVPMDDTEEARVAASLVEEFVKQSHTVLDRNEVNVQRRARGIVPANLILTRDAGDALPKFPKFRELYNVKAGCMVEMPVERGIALLCGMEEVVLPPPSKDLKADYIHRAAKTVNSLKGFDVLYIHIKGPDEPGHDGDFERKKEIIELIDRYFFANLLPEINTEETVIATTADHSTPCSLKAHSADPVPLMISGGTIQPDSSKTFSEKECRGGGIGTIRGPELMPMLMKLIKS
jgi:2,3-bisphosphoglycerate-independent phosphoglycerate mutase